MDVLLVEKETDADMDVLKAVQETGVVILGTKDILPGSTVSLGIISWRSDGFLVAVAGI